MSFIYVSGHSPEPHCLVEWLYSAVPTFDWTISYTDYMVECSIKDISIRRQYVIDLSYDYAKKKKKKKKRDAFSASFKDRC